MLSQAFHPLPKFSLKLFLFLSYQSSMFDLLIDLVLRIYLDFSRWLSLHLG
jgi:hypothetical protein